MSISATVKYMAHPLTTSERKATGFAWVIISLSGIEICRVKTLDNATVTDAINKANGVAA